VLWCLEQVLLAAVSRFYASHMLQRGEPAALTTVRTEVEGGVMLSAMADDRLADALQVIEAMGNFFNVSASTCVASFLPWGVVFPKECLLLDITSPPMPPGRGGGAMQNGRLLFRDRWREGSPIRRMW